MRLAVIALAGAVHARNDRYGDVDFSSSGYGSSDDGYGSSGALGGGFGGDDEGYDSSFGDFDDGFGSSSGYGRSAGRSQGRSQGRSAGQNYGTSRAAIGGFGNDRLSDRHGASSSRGGSGGRRSAGFDYSIESPVNEGFRSQQSNDGYSDTA